MGGGSGGPTILDLQSGALSLQDKFVDVWTAFNLTGKRPFTRSDVSGSIPHPSPPLTLLHPSPSPTPPGMAQVAISVETAFTTYYPPPATYHLPFATYRILPNTHYLLLTMYPILLTTFYLLPTIHYLLCITYYPLPNAHYRILMYYLMPTTFHSPSVPYYSRTADRLLSTVRQHFG